MEPNQRLTCAELLAHAFFDDYEPMKPPAVKTRKTRVSFDNSKPYHRRHRYCQFHHNFRGHSDYHLQYCCLDHALS